MTKNSLICRIINDNPKNWKQIIEAKGINIKEDGDLAIFNYGIPPQSTTFFFKDPVIQEARGIIINTKTREVACWPFRKFGNSCESYADKIDWKSAKVQEKLDGSIIKLWYNKIREKWTWSTNTAIYAKDASNYIGKTFRQLIKETSNYKDINLARLNKNNTYIFELIHPYNQIVIKYDIPKLIHIGTRSNITGKEYNEDIGIQKPKEYPLKTLDECIDAAGRLNRTYAGTGLGIVKSEGFVIVDKNWNRIKIKSPEYLLQHRLASVDFMSKKMAITLLMKDSFNLNNFCKAYPKFSVPIKFYDFQLTQLLTLSNEFADYVNSIYEEFSYERKAVALKIRNHPLAPVGFWALSHRYEDAKNYWKDLISAKGVNSISRFVPDYNLITIFSMDKEPDIIIEKNEPTSIKPKISPIGKKHVSAQSNSKTDSDNNTQAEKKAKSLYNQNSRDPFSRLYKNPQAAENIDDWDFKDRKKREPETTQIEQSQEKDSTDKQALLKMLDSLEVYKGFYIERKSLDMFDDYYCFIAYKKGRNKRESLKNRENSEKWIKSKRWKNRTVMSEEYEKKQLDEIKKKILNALFESIPAIK